MRIELHHKYNNLITYFKNLSNVSIAYSGGVDSTLLIYIAKLSLKDKALAVTVKTPYTPQWEIEEAIRHAKEIGIKHIVIENEIPSEIKNNPHDRCYLCKKQLFNLIVGITRKNGCNYLVEGTNVDDEKDYRPGLKALSELNVKSPFRELGFTKSDIRELSKELKLVTWNKPAYACLLTRLPFNTKIHEQDLKAIEKGELFLHKCGFKHSRLRSHGKLARIEIKQNRFALFLHNKKHKEIIEYLKTLGFDYVCLDLEGYTMGSFNKEIL